MAKDLARVIQGGGETALERILREVEALTDEEAAKDMDSSSSRV
jgi:hypothetical protein